MTISIPRDLLGKLGLEFTGSYRLVVEAINRIHANGQLRARSYTVATLPNASDISVGSLAYVSDETGGAVLAFTDGTNWRRVTDRAIVS